jgi:BirA family biotin operon repressor/biotin-[acetyl-CoA-carboxylase] ligase
MSSLAARFVRNLASQLPETYELLHLETVDSTNEQARRLADQGVRVPHWIVADHQTAGRGRRGRVWDSPNGNLMTTLYLPVSLSPEEAGQLSFVAGLALQQTVAGYIGDAGAVSLKWPNDVLIDGAKVSGILLETASSRENRIDWLAIGMGLNLQEYPTDTPYPANSVKAVVGTAPSNLEAAHHLAENFDQFYRQWKTVGFASILMAWRQVAQNFGKHVAARLENETIEGIFVDIDGSGALILETFEGARHTISAADIFFPNVSG